MATVPETCPRLGLPHQYWPQGNCQYCGAIRPANTSKILSQYEAFLEEAEDAERFYSAKLSEARRHKSHWQRKVAEIKAEIAA